MTETDTKTLVAAMRILAGDIVSGDGIASATINEAADCLEELAEQLDEVQKISGLISRIISGEIKFKEA